MRLVMNSLNFEEKCKICTKIEVKKRAIHKENDRIKRWAHEGGRTHSIEKSRDSIAMLEDEINRLEWEKEQKRNNLSGGRW